MAGFPLPSEYGIQALNTVVINLVKDRTQGENFPELYGSFFYVESVDLPCRASFTVSDDTQSVGLSSGFQLNMPFKGITLFHDNYTVVSSRGFSLRGFLSRDPRSYTQFVLPATQLPQPGSAQAIAGSFASVYWPVTAKMRFATLNGSIVVPTAAGNMWAYVRFRDAGFNIIQGPSATKPPTVFAYASLQQHQTQLLTPTLYFGTENHYRVLMQNIPLPSNCAFLEMRMEWNPATVPVSYNNFVECYVF